MKSSADCPFEVKMNAFLEKWSARMCKYLCGDLLPAKPHTMSMLIVSNSFEPGPSFPRRPIFLFVLLFALDARLAGVAECLNYFVQISTVAEWPDLVGDVPRADVAVMIMHLANQAAGDLLRHLDSLAPSQLPQRHAVHVCDFLLLS